MADGKPRKINWTWRTAEHTDRVAYVSVDGRMSVTDLIAYLAEAAPGVPLSKINLNWATATWVRPANAEELAEREQRNEQVRARTEEWERATLARLTEKYGRPRE